MTDIIVRAKPSAKQNLVEKVTATEYIVRTTEPPVQGRANRSIIQLLASYFHVSAHAVSILSGHTSRTKNIRIHGI